MELLNVWMIIGFLLAAYAVVGNDSIQTLGTFIASNRKVKWYWLWAFAGSILVGTLTWSWVVNGGDISWGRLNKIDFVEVQWYHAMAPLVLVALTRLGIPVSTSLLVLSAFASSLVFEKILMKSALGYAIAAVVAYGLWIAMSRWENKAAHMSKVQEKRWRAFQWGATGFLWFTWLSHDMANIMVFLPRELDVGMLVCVLVVLVGGLGWIFYQGGGKIQEVVVEKTNVAYVRSATIVDLLYAFILLFFKQYNDIPMSTTWVFIGLLAGRELAIRTMMKNTSAMSSFPIVGKDMARLLFGLGVSILLALSIQNVDTIIALLRNW